VIALIINTFCINQGCGAASFSRQNYSAPSPTTVARLFQSFPAKAAGKFEKIRPLFQSCGKQHRFQLLYTLSK
jgi:hypothetical protein